MKYILLLLSLLSSKVYSQTNKFILLDSITINASSDNHVSRSVNLVDNAIIVRFEKYDSLNYRVEFVTNNDKHYPFTFTQKNSKKSICYTTPVFVAKTGYAFFQYHADENFIEYDTLKKEVKIQKVNLYSKDGEPWANNHLFIESSGGLFHSNLLVSINGGVSISTNNSKRFISSLINYYKKQTLLMLYDKDSEKTIRKFVKYPENYSSNLGLFVNKGFSFCSSDKTNKVYVSFNGLNNIYVYDKENNVTGIEAKGLQLNNDYLATKEKVEIRLSALKDYFHLLVDSYDDIAIHNNKIFRTYKLHLNPEDVQDVVPPPNSKTCPTGNVLLKMYEYEYNKTKYLQQFSLNGEKENELKYPEGMNTFIGYDKNNVFYFRNLKSLSTNDKGKVVVYCYKTN